MLNHLLNRCHIGDCLDVLRGLPDGLVNMCVTSPPYYGLRDYGHPGQIGLEASPDEYVAKMVEVFREVRRVLRDDGTLWLNLGDSYAGSRGGGAPSEASTLQGNGHVGGGPKVRGTTASRRSDDEPIPRSDVRVAGLKSKDLIGIPWMLARALRDPYYTGPVKDVCDQVWLAAMLDAEGSICGTEYQSGDRIKTNIYISITNTSVPLIEKCDRLFPQDLKHIYEKTNGASNRKCFRWDVERMDQKALFLRTIYPHLVAKRKQAIIGYTFIEMQRGLVSKKKGYLAEQHEQRSWLMQALSLLNSGQDVDIPDWCVEPPSLFEPGYYLRQDIIWAKPNPMPESVRDRCTKSHEYLFLLSKSERYYFDSEAMKEPAVGGLAGNTKPTKGGRAYEAGASEHRTAAGLHKWAERQRARVDEPNRKALRTDTESRHRSSIHGGQSLQADPDGFRNRRSVWTVATRPYKGAHFATYPPELIEPCVLAGCPDGGVVLDPFFGSGTTGYVAEKLGRAWVGIEINPEYQALQLERTQQMGLIAPAGEAA